MDYKVINREKEIQELEKRYYSDIPEFVAVYGRQRVGKTYLINSVFSNKFTFKHSGLSPTSYNTSSKNRIKKTADQLKHFHNSLIQYGLKKSKCPSDWLEAFYLLEQLLEEKEDGSKMVVFLDEIQWMDTPRSNFLAGLESFWNGWVCYEHNVLLIVCGSSTSWVLDNLVNNYGGLYGRITSSIKLKQFNLCETEKYLKSINVELSRYDITQLYMTLGGIPFYLEKLKPGYSVAQNIDYLFFDDNAIFKDEFDRLFSSTFSKPETMKAIIKVLFTKNRGLTRNELIEQSNISSSGNLSKMLKALENGDFVLKYYSFGSSKKECFYKLIDPFCLFYLQFVEGKTSFESNYWMNNIDAQKSIVWKGYAFENICFNHIQQIKTALGINGVSTKESIWSKRGNENAVGTQIDLIIERKDNIINMCEIKFYNDKVIIDKDYHFKLATRDELILQNSSPKMTVHNVLISTFGVKKAEYWGDFRHVITLDELFR